MSRVVRNQTQKTYVQHGKGSRIKKIEENEPENWTPSAVMEARGGWRVQGRHGDGEPGGGETGARGMGGGGVTYISPRMCERDFEMWLTP